MINWYRLNVAQDKNKCAIIMGQYYLHLTQMISLRNRAYVDTECRERAAWREMATCSYMKIRVHGERSDGYTPAPEYTGREDACRGRPVSCD